MDELSLVTTGRHNISANQMGLAQKEGVQTIVSIDELLEIGC